jgi:hypothetical protein
MSTVDCSHRWPNRSKKVSRFSSGLSLLSIVIFGYGGCWNLGIRKPLGIRTIQIEVHLVPLILHLQWLRCARAPFSEQSRPNFKPITMLEDV